MASGSRLSPAKRERCKELLKKGGISQRAISLRLGIGYSTVNHINKELKKENRNDRD